MSSIPRIAALAVAGVLLLPRAASARVGDQLDIADNGPVITVAPSGDPGDMIDRDVWMVVGQESSVWDLP